jgi:hypothetical protein
LARGDKKDQTVSSVELVGTTEKPQRTAKGGSLSFKEKHFLGIRAVLEH